MLLWIQKLGFMLCLLYIFTVGCYCRIVVRIGALVPGNNPDYEDSLQTAVRVVNTDEVTQYLNITFLEHIAYTSNNPEKTIMEICDGVVNNSVSVILMVADDITKFTLSLVGAFVGIPIIGFGSQYAVLSDKDVHPMYLRMDPPLAMQAYPIRDILKSYKWNKFSVIYSDDQDGVSFLNELRRIAEKEEFEIEAEIELPVDNMGNISSNLIPLRHINSKVIILQISQNDAVRVFNESSDMGLLDAGYAWILTEALLATSQQNLQSFPMGLIGVNNSAHNKLTSRITDAVHSIARAVQKMYSDFPTGLPPPPNSCWNPKEENKMYGEKLYRYLKQTNFRRNGDTISFDYNGDLNVAAYDILNLRENDEQGKGWINVGTWSEDNLNMNSIQWPGQTEVMPNFDKAKRQLIIVTIEEKPFMFKSDLADRRECFTGGLCLKFTENPNKKTSEDDVKNAFKHWREVGMFTNSTTHSESGATYTAHCCSGMAYDILERLSRDMNFDYDLYIVADGHFGSEEKNVWNGMVGDLTNHVADMAVASFSINSARSQVIDFSAPFYDTSLSIVVARRKGKASIGSFMEPLEWSMWLGIFITLHATAFFATIYEWHSPYGLTPHGRNRRRVFSFPSALTLCWSILFSHTVPSKSPKCWASRFLINLWAIFSLVFIASYTANLAAFMVSEKQPNEITGINDPKLQHESKGFSTATIKSSSPESFLWRSYPELAQKISKHAVNSTQTGIQKLKNGKLDAFIWDSAVLDYQISSDPKCELKLVGKRFASEGYGIGLEKNSILTHEVSQHIYKYFSSGYLEQLHRQWYNTAGCSKQAKGMTGESTLDLSHFIGVFILLCTGIIIATVTLGLEWFVERILVPRWRKDVRKLNWLPLTQRLHRAVHSPTLVQDNTYSARGQQIPLKNIGSRLCEHRNRRDSGDVSYDISKYLTTRHDRQESTPLLNNSSRAVAKIKPLIALKQVNIAVQTDIDEKVNYQLREVDANINSRIKNFESDLHDMRQQLAKALKEKEQLLRKLAEFEDHHRMRSKRNSSSSGSTTNTYNSVFDHGNPSNSHDELHQKNYMEASVRSDDSSQGCASHSMVKRNVRNTVRNPVDDRVHTDVDDVHSYQNPVNFKPCNSIFKPRPSYKSPDSSC
ncbi:glutamate receptor ionotropic, NMDA 3A-like [Glandiceps talaboti]